MNKIKIDKKVKMIFEKIKNGEYVEVKKNKCYENGKEARKVVCNSSYILEMHYIYENVLEKDECWNSETNGLNKEDFVNLYEMQQNDPNMFDREAMK